MTILVIEDEQKLSDILKKALTNQRYAVDTAFDGEIGLQKAMKNNYALIILDIMLPKKDGMEVCKELRAHQVQTPIVMLTARGVVEDRIQGLDIGADDYLIKPFGIDELFARIRAVLRRRKVIESTILKIGDLIFDKTRHEVIRAGKSIALTPKEYRLLETLIRNNILETLIRNNNQALTRRQLIDEAWGPEFKESNNELNVHIRYLRRKIDGDNQKPLIHTIRGVGYTLKE
jgi:DNA-binding response OmpR family regulator